MEQAILDKVKNEMLNSNIYEKVNEMPTRNMAAITIHVFDNIRIRQAHNGQESYDVNFRGQSIGRIPRDDFYSIIEERKNKAVNDFLNLKWE